MISTQGLTRTFRKKKSVVEAVRGIDLTVNPGELVAFLGPNGAGKSTTLRMLTGLLAPTSGTAQVAGIDVFAHPQRVRQTIGYIGQGNSAGHFFRVGDELASQAQFYRIPPAQARLRAAELLEALDLAGLEKRTVNTLSGGQRRRLDVAMGLLNRPDLMFLDEPTTGMDPTSRANLWEHVQRMRREFSMTLLLTTHYLEEADRMAERVVIIDNGTIIADDTPVELRRRYAHDTIVLEYLDDVAASEARGLLEGRFRVRCQDRSLHLDLDEGALVLPSLLAGLESAGRRPHRAAITEATLDDVFLNLTGRSLRESAEAGDDQAPGAGAAAQGIGAGMAGAA